LCVPARVGKKKTKTIKKSEKRTENNQKLIVSTLRGGQEEAVKAKGKRLIESGQRRVEKGRSIGTDVTGWGGG